MRTNLQPMLIAKMVLTLAQLAIVGRLLFSALQRIPRDVPAASDADRQTAMTVIIPVYNEQSRLAPCLEGVLRFSHLVQEILVVDTGSTDRTCALAQSYAVRDQRIRVVSAGDPPHGWNGKSWGIVHGIKLASPESEWILLLDADVRPSPTLPDRLLAACEELGVRCASVALLQAPAADPLSWLLHPAMLTSLVYRVGLPGQIARSPDQVFANGQALILHRHLLAALDNGRRVAFANAEDLALARALSAMGEPIAFLDALDDSFVTMYPEGRQVWTSWPRSLHLKESRGNFAVVLDLALLTVTQGAWLPLCLISLRSPTLRLPAFLSAAVRLGILAGMERAYRWHSWWYWLSPAVDVFVVARIIQAATVQRPVWRGRTIGQGGQP